MSFKKIVFFQYKKFNHKNFNLVKAISKKLDEELFILALEVDDFPLEQIQQELQENNINYRIEIKDNFDESINVVKDYNPDLLILTKEKIDPLEHIFHHTYCEKILEEFENINVLALQEDKETLKTGLIYVSKDNATEEFIKIAKYFADNVLEDFKFIYSFYEDFYEKRLTKTHTEGEAKQIIAEMFKDHVDGIKSLIAKALGDQKVELLVIKGDPKKEIPYYARLKRYDILIFNRNVEDRESFIENSETSICILLD
ncbi:hypothetical protein [Persephonella sp.]